MTGSMYAAVSGLKAHMNALNVIGNNVSNVNTTAYKATRYTFNEALYTTQRSGSDGTAVAGGRNPAQVGFGGSIGTIDLDMSTKNYTPTGQLLDTMIDGDGFFFVGDKELGNGATALSINDQPALAGMKLTRLGNFNIDPNGYLVDGNGSVVWGYLEENLDLTTKYDLNTGKIVTETESSSSSGSSSSSSSTETEASVKELRYMTEDEIAKLQKLGVNIHNVKFDKLSAERVKYLTNTSEDKLSEADKELKKRVTSTDPKDKLEADQSYLVSVTLTNNSSMGAIRLPMKTAQNEVAWPHYVDKTGVQYDEDGNITQPAEPAKFKDDESLGSTRLQPDSVSIDEKSGALRVMTSDGELLTVGYLAVAKVTNPNGVTHVDGRYFQAQDGAGTLRATTIKGAVSGIKDASGNVSGPESAGDTKLITGGLESSGTDLATEITNMITVQRGYQANTRIVTVTDSMLEELVNMKR